MGAFRWVVLAMAILIGIAVFASMAHSFSSPSPSGPCVGGPVMGATGQPVGNGNYKFPCTGGGSTVVHIGN